MASPRCGCPPCDALRDHPGGLVAMTATGDSNAPADDGFPWDEQESTALIEARAAAEQVASTDTVRVYLKKIGRVALLTAEQEVDLAKRIEAGLYATELLRADEAEQKLTREESRDLLWVVRDGERARNHLLEANLRLVVSLAK